MGRLQNPPLSLWKKQAKQQEATLKAQGCSQPLDRGGRWALRRNKAAKPPKFSEWQCRKCHQMCEPHRRVGKEANHYIRWDPLVFHTTKQGCKSDRARTKKESGMMEYVIKPMPLWKYEWVVTLLFRRKQQNLGQIMLIHCRIFKHILC